MRKDMIVIKKALLAAAAVLLTIHAGGASMEAYAYHGATGHHGYVFSDDAEYGPGSLGAWRKLLEIQGARRRLCLKLLEAYKGNGLLL